MEGFEPPRRFSTPTSRFSRPFPSTAWVHLQMYSRSNVSRKKERNLERNPDFLLTSCRRNPLKTQGKLKNGFQNALPFSRPVPSTAWVHLQMYSRSNVSRKKGEKLGEKSRFSLNFLQPQPVENTGKIEKRLPVFKVIPLCPLWQRPMARRTAVCSKKLPQIPRTVNRKTPLYNDFRQKGVA